MVRQSTRLSSISTPSVGRSLHDELEEAHAARLLGVAGEQDDAVGQELGADGERVLVDVEVGRVERVPRAVERRRRPGGAGSRGTCLR